MKTLVLRLFCFTLLLLGAFQGMAQATCPLPRPTATVIGGQGLQRFVVANHQVDSVYWWQLNGALLAKDTMLAFTAPRYGTYPLLLTYINDQPRCQVTDTVYVNVCGPAPTFRQDTVYSGPGQRFIAQHVPDVLTWSLNGVTVGTGDTLVLNQLAAGSYILCLSQSCGGQTCQQITIPAQCTAVTPQYMVSGSGNSRRFSVLGQTQDSLIWTIGGRMVSTASSFTYRFDSSGTFNVCLQAVRSATCAGAVSCRSVTISCATQSLAFSSVGTGLTKTLSLLNPVNDSIQWSVDGQTIGYGNGFVYSFPRADTFNVCATNLGATLANCPARSCRPVVVTTCTASQPVIAAGVLGNTVTYTNTTAGNNLTEWIINNVVVATGSVLNYTFLVNGQYQVCARSIDVTSGCQFSACRTETVTMGANCQSITPRFLAGWNGNTVVLSANEVADTTIWTINGTELRGQQVTYNTGGLAGPFNVCLSYRYLVAPTCRPFACSTIVRPVIPSCNFNGLTLTVTGTGLQRTLTTNTQVDSVQWLLYGQVVAQGNNTTYQFPAPGSYQLCLRLRQTNAPACTKDTCVIVTIPVTLSNSIEGKVFVRGTLVANDTYVELIKLNDSTNFLQTTMTVNGAYAFTNLPNGNYLVRSILTPSTPAYLSFVPTYYPTAIAWGGAVTITIPGQTQSYDVDMRLADSTTGSGSIVGTIGGNNDSIPFNARVAATGLIKFELNRAVVLVENTAIGEVMARRPQANGQYRFDDVPYGNYRVSLEYPRVSPHYVVVNVSAATPDYTVDFNKVLPTVVTDLAERQPTRVELYPNPVRDQLMLSLPDDGAAEIMVVNSLGQRVPVSVLVNNKHQIIDVRHLPAGLYRVDVQLSGSRVSKSFLRE